MMLADVQTIQDRSQEAEEGTTTGLIGPNGAPTQTGTTPAARIPCEKCLSFLIYLPMSF